jgi:hypothetical protein
LIPKPLTSKTYAASDNREAGQLASVGPKSQAFLP